jgi:hypothetical protein
MNKISDFYEAVEHDKTFKPGGSLSLSDVEGVVNLSALLCKRHCDCSNVENIRSYNSSFQRILYYAVITLE